MERLKEYNAKRDTLENYSNERIKSTLKSYNLQGLIGLIGTNSKDFEMLELTPNGNNEENIFMAIKYAVGIAKENKLDIRQALEDETYKRMTDD